MKILFIVRGDHPDYQSDAIMHGGRNLFGADFVDCNRVWYMYRDDRDKYWRERIPNNGKSFGHGFTLSGTLDNIEIDRTDIPNKIINKYFDLIIYGSVTRCFQHLDLVSKYYDKSKVIFIDGEDDQYIRTNLFQFGHMFKRELVFDNPTSKGAHSINFGIPKEKIVKSIPEKKKDWATIIPGKMETYIFDDEESYYRDYQNSMFALTHKKGGWDCLRHYEILMNGCVTYFPDLKQCPYGTMHRYPRDLINDSNQMIDSNIISVDWYNNLVDKLLAHTREQLTTEVTVKDILVRVPNSKS